MGIKFNIDTSSITSQLKEFALEVEQDLQKAAADLALLTKEKVLELANENLSSTGYESYKEGVGTDDTAPGIWIVYIDEKVAWQESGLKEGFDMKPGLLKGATKVSKDGHHYRSIPFDHGKAPSKTANSPKAQELVSQVKSFLKKEKIPFRKIEKDANGSPLTGKLHKFDIPSDPPTDRASTSALKGLTIYQTKMKNGSVRRDILTFRTVSDGPASANKWIHPGYQAKNFLDQAAEWATREWEDKILPDIINRWK